MLNIMVNLHIKVIENYIAPVNWKILFYSIFANKLMHCDKCAASKCQKLI